MIDKKIKEIVCDYCGKVDYGLIDGYCFGDRLLEGVNFQVYPLNGKFEVRIDPDCALYFADLNQEKWLKEAYDYANINTDVLECPKCGEDIYYDE